MQLECAGGDLQAARELAQKLTELQEKGLMVVAFVPDRAPDTAAVVALGCTEIVMSKRTDAAGGDEPAEAEFGDFEAALGKPETNADLLAASLRELAEAQGYPPVLIDGMLDRDLEIVRVQKKENATVRRLMTEAEFEDQTGRRPVGQPVTVKPKGQLLKLTATQARASSGWPGTSVDTRDPAEVYARYGVDPAQVKEATPGVAGPVRHVPEAAGGDGAAGGDRVHRADPGAEGARARPSRGSSRPCASSWCSGRTPSSAARWRCWPAWCSSSGWS